MSTDTKIPTQPKTRLYELLDTNESSYQLESSDGGNSGIFLAAPSQRVIMSTTVMVDKNTNEHTRIRYIKGCPFIELSIQNEKGYKPNLATGADIIVFVNGKLVIVEEGDGITLAKFIDNHAGNMSNENRRVDATPIFREVVKAKQLEKGLDEYFTEQKVIKSLGSIATKVGSSIQYDMEKLNYLCSLFKIVVENEDDPSEKLHAIITYGKQNPEKFISATADDLADVKAIINQGVHLGIVAFDEQNFIFTEGLKPILKLKKKLLEKQQEEVADYLNSKEGAADLEQIRTFINNS